MTGNLRSEINETIGPVPNQYVDYKPIVSIPLGVVIDWTPHVIVKELMNSQEELFEGKATNLQGMSVTPNLIKGRSSIIKSTTYESSDAGVVEQKIQFVNNVPDNTAPVFGFWSMPSQGNSYAFHINQAQAGEYMIGNIEVKIPIIEKNIECMYTPDAEPGYYQKRAQVGFDVNCQVSDKEGQKHFSATYGFIQIITTYLIAYRNEVTVAAGLRIQSDGRKLLDIKKGGVSAFYNDDQFGEGATPHLGDAPEFSLFQYIYKTLNPSCTSISDQSDAPDFLSVKYSEYLLDFSTYLMMKVDEDTLKQELELEGRSFWVPVKDFRWNANIQAKCNVESCNVPMGIAPGNWVLTGNSAEEGTVISPLPSWDNNAATYNGFIGSKTVNSYRCPCLQGTLEDSENTFYDDIFDHETLLHISEIVPLD